MVDGDDEFRARVAAEVDEDEVGAAGWLWLTRPERWMEGVARLQEDADATAGAVAAARSERNARRKLKAARTAADKAEAKARARAAEVDELRAQLAVERARRSAAESERDNLATELRRTGHERDRALQRLQDAETGLAARASEVQQALVRVSQLESELDRNRDVQRVDDTSGETGSGDDTSGEAPSGDDTSGVGSIDTWALTEALHATAAGVQTLSQALDKLGTLLEQVRGTESSVVSRGIAPQGLALPPDDPTVTSPAAREAEGSQGDLAEPRLPLSLPGGLTDDSVEAATLLLKTPSVLVLVDGYNVSMCGWPELPIGEQRARLLSALNETAARSGADVEVIFDGTDIEPSGRVQSRPTGVRQRFSPPDVEADDVLLGLLARTPANRPVVVVSSDNRVRKGARRHGANLVHARQLLDLLRR